VFVIVPGVALLLWGLLLRGEPGVGLASAGGIVTAIGLLLAYQWTTGHWASWAYAWALIPSGAGAAMLLWALLHRRGSAARAGLSTLTFGAIMFLVGFGFFEGILNIGGDRGLAPLAGQLLPIALIAAGALIIVSRLWPRRGVDGDAPPAQPADWPAEDQRSTEV